jgi:hypothetical protein
MATENPTRGYMRIQGAAAPFYLTLRPLTESSRASRSSAVFDEGAADVPAECESEGPHAPHARAIVSAYVRTTRLRHVRISAAVLVVQHGIPKVDVPSKFSIHVSTRVRHASDDDLVGHEHRLAG